MIKTDNDCNSAKLKSNSQYERGHVIREGWSVLITAFQSENAIRAAAVNNPDTAIDRNAQRDYCNRPLNEESLAIWQRGEIAPQGKSVTECPFII